MSHPDFVFEITRKVRVDVDLHTHRAMISCETKDGKSIRLDADLETLEKIHEKIQNQLAARLGDCCRHDTENVVARPGKLKLRPKPREIRQPLWPTPPHQNFATDQNSWRQTGLPIAYLRIEVETVSRGRTCWRIWRRPGEPRNNRGVGNENSLHAVEQTVRTDMIEATGRRT